MRKQTIAALCIIGASALLSATALVSAETDAQQAETVVTNNGGITSLRGNVELNTQQQPEELKKVITDRDPISRQYVHQPPVIPHSIRHYEVDLNANKCLSCHSWKNAPESGATKISPTHFETREGMTLSDVSPRRYFCLQCHVPQADAKPLVKNNFKPVDALK
ncbi:MULTISPECIES: nitrate reductase cytochrome c-type subunit [unclassified Motilimonas]|uniref:nitrate reductase cytochrome c-type subunit n=1 Tax=Motilimonas TaxID=1914248 RepID=UPI001E5BD652|nr:MULTISPECIES: nitrate reductase cytochrome c-type subunit [unclassified Motilimonas]MCE0558808.1 nitrate reductase cytochrome c-type subunit [Motilimonas sp. E26]MDO6526519.1 nitrate reductase cytochrome c-type subunit [Motilimonas sp. 1_MG-2023]